MDQFGRHWQSDLPGDKREFTLLRKRNQIMDCIRKFGLHPLWEDEIPKSKDLSLSDSCADRIVGRSLTLGGNRAMANENNSRVEWELVSRPGGHEEVAAARETPIDIRVENDGDFLGSQD